MNHTVKMNELCDKLNDLKSVFRYGQKMIPIIQNLLDFMKETVPLLENINSSITESTQKMPKATNQISSVTNATELATTEILNIIDIISEDINWIGNAAAKLSEIEESRSQITDKLSSLNLPAEAKHLVMQFSELKKEIPDYNLISEKVTGINNNAYNITLSLQVQDITSQQLAAVNHLIESVQYKLSSLVRNLEDSELPGAPLLNLNEYENELPFNSEAEYSSSLDKQQIADSIMNNRTITPQDEIDKLFSRQ
jgi:chemotaxis regulatin CheY-phosphate phosphatase CheZ